MLQRKASRRVSFIRAGSKFGIALAALLVLSSSLVGNPASAAIELDEAGSWGPVGDWPLVAIHAALDSSGNVVTYGSRPDGSSRAELHYDVWKPSGSPAQGHSLLQHGTSTNFFCGLQINRPDNGNLLILGGGYAVAPNGDISEYDPTTKTVSSLPGMKRERWYGTVITLPDESVYVQGGIGGEDRAELWTPEAGSQILPFDTAHLDWWYPRLFVMSDGRIFGIDTRGEMFFVDDDLQTLTMVGTLDPQFRGVFTTAVMFRQDRILFLGGSTTEALIIDVTSGDPIVSSGGTLSDIRKWADSTLLPDGRVLITGGGRVAADTEGAGLGVTDYGPSYTAEIWDPATRTWSVGDDAQIPRLYHSTSILLPDGRVLSAGGGNPGPVTNLNAEIYSPDYLIKADGSRTDRTPILGLSTTNPDPGSIVSVKVENPNAIDRVTLVKAGSVTHSLNVDQRFLELSFTRWNGEVRARIPASSPIVTPGEYLLTVIDADGVPSRSKLVTIRSNNVSKLQSDVTFEPQVYRLYLGVFGRAPKLSGLQYWSSERAGGRSLLSIANHFVKSPEFQARYGALSQGGFVDLVYQNILNRRPTPAGRSFWIFQLQSGMSRAEMMVQFTTTTEFKNRLGPII